MPRIKPAPFVRVLAGQRAAARTRPVPAQFTKQATESQADVTASTWAGFKARRAVLPLAEEDKDKDGPREDETVLASKRKVEWKRRQGVCA